MHRLVELEHALEWRSPTVTPPADTDVLTVVRDSSGGERYEVLFWSGDGWDDAIDSREEEVIAWREILNDFWTYNPEKN